MDKGNLVTVEKMWRREVEAATTYRHLANRETDPKRRDILIRLAEQEEKHAARWAERIAAATGRQPDPKEVERGLSWFQRISDPSVVLHRLEQEENKAEAEYDQLMSRLNDPADRLIAEEAMLEERDHAVVLRTLAGGALPTPRSTLDTILRRERWHVRGTGWIGDAIYGVNDGLGAVFGIVSGMAGYTGGRGTARARALLSAQGLLRRGIARDGGAAPERAETVPPHAGPGGARAVGGIVSEPVALDDLGGGLHGHRRFSFPSFRSSSRSACQPSWLPLSSARLPTSPSAPPRRSSPLGPGGRAGQR